MCNFRRIRQYLTWDTTLMISNAMVGCKLNSCNCLCRSLSSAYLRKLQCVQNSLPQIVYGTLAHYTHKKGLHQLSIQQQCICKTTLKVAYNLLFSDSICILFQVMQTNYGLVFVIYAKHRDKFRFFPFCFQMTSTQFSI